MQVGADCINRCSLDRPLAHGPRPQVIMTLHHDELAHSSGVAVAAWSFEFPRGQTLIQ